MQGKYIILYRQNVPHRILNLEPVVYKVEKLLGKQKLVISLAAGGTEVVARKQSTLGDHIGFIGDSLDQAVAVLKEVTALNAQVTILERGAQRTIDMLRTRDIL